MNRKMKSQKRFERISCYLTEVFIHIDSVYNNTKRNNYQIFFAIRKFINNKWSY